ncbi:MAG: ABC transporter ATP-binding protein [Chloroflexota bacterium]|nr:ABC transporter ATP-binding protein [Chloroflexota bacterium]
MASVHLKAVSKRFGNITAVKDIDLSVSPGEFVILVGPSGCGKTTTLRMIAGLEEISSGDMYIEGLHVNDLPPRLRDVAMVFQNYSLYSHMSVRDNLGFGLKMRRTPKGEMSRKIVEIADTLHISDLLDRRPSQLSGGEKQRVAIGRALVRSPKVYLMDEPLSNLDAKLRLEMRSEIRRIHQRFRTTTVYVTHDQAEAMSMADRLVVMDAGMVMQEGSPIDVYANPHNIFVAQFLGNPGMNLVGGQLVSQPQGLYFRNEVINFPLFYDTIHAVQKSNCASKDEFFLGIRPEDLRVTSPGKDSISVQGEVLVVEPLGGETQALLQVGKHELRLKAPPQSSLHPGDNVSVNFERGSAHLFHGPTGIAVG